jgi:peptidoglycan-associated lipoprotein
MKTKTFGAPALAVVAALALQGCLATRNWVSEQLTPLGQRVSDTEARLSKTDGRVDKVEGRLSGLEGQFSSLDGRIGQVDSKAEKALAGLANLRLDRKLVLTMREGAQFPLNSAAFNEQTKREIDGFLSDLKNDIKEGDSVVFLIAGHTDSTGSEDYNYELGAKRAQSVARYLITRKGVDPTRVITVSYGESNPLEDNKTRQGRAKNRRVEILVYREAITTEAAAPQQTASAPADPVSRASR